MLPELFIYMTIVVLYAHSYDTSKYADHYWDITFHQVTRERNVWTTQAPMYGLPVVQYVGSKIPTTIHQCNILLQKQFKPYPWLVKLHMKTVYMRKITCLASTILDITYIYGLMYPHVSNMTLMLLNMYCTVPSIFHCTYIFILFCNSAISVLYQWMVENLNYGCVPPCPKYDDWVITRWLYILQDTYCSFFFPPYDAQTTRSSDLEGEGTRVKRC